MSKKFEDENSAMDKNSIDDIVIEEIDIDDIEDYQPKEDLDTTDTTTADKKVLEATVAAEETAFADAQKEIADAVEQVMEEASMGETQANTFEEASEGKHSQQVVAEDKADGKQTKQAVQKDKTDSKAARPILEEDEDDDEEKAIPVKKKRKKGDFLRYTVMFVALCVLVYSLFSLVTIFLEYKAAEDEYKDLGVIAQATEDPNQQERVEYIDEQYPLNPNYQIKNIDWAGLQAQNGDSCAWIQFETLQEEINYPIVHGTDNLYYLSHTISHAENSAGTLFVDAQNRSDFTDMNTFVYGHNMKNGSMFGLLRYYKDASYYAGNEYFWIYTPQANYRYKIFSCYEPKAVSETYTWWSDPCDEYTDYLNKVISYSKYDTGVKVNPTDHIVTLSTCTSRGSDYRFVVHAKLVYSSVNQ